MKIKFQFVMIFLIYVQNIFAQFEAKEFEQDIDKSPFYNNTLNLIRLADSTMISIFGKDGFNQYFKQTCFKDRCFYNDTVKNITPCDTFRSDCSEAYITYSYVKDKVPLEIVMHSHYGEASKFCTPIISRNYFQTKIPLSHLNLLSEDEIIEKNRKKFKKIGIYFSIYPDMHYSTNPITDPFFLPYQNDSASREYPQKKVIKNKASKKWTGGFYYTMHKYFFYKVGEVLYVRKKIFIIDACNGSFLYEIILIGKQIGN